MMHRYIRELVGAAACASVSAALWCALGTVYTWAVWRPYLFHRLDTPAYAAIVVPSFTLGWMFFLARHATLVSRARWVATTVALAMLGAVMWLMITDDHTTWYVATGDTFATALERCLTSLVRALTTTDARWAHHGSAILVAATAVAGALVGAVTYRAARLMAEAVRA